jgi:hypothetical protein
MRRATYLVFVLSLLSSLTTVSFGAAPEPPQRSVLAEVAALDKPVTYTELKIPLGELVQRIATDTGAPLTAAGDVADEPVAVIVKELPARELLEQLADLLDYRWSQRRSGVQASGRSSVRGMNNEQAATTGEQPKLSAPEHLNARTPERLNAVYEIWQDLASKQREEALRRASVGEVEKRFRESLQRYLQVGTMLPDQIKELAKSPPLLFPGLEKLSPEEQQSVRNSPEAYDKMQRWSVARTLQMPLPRVLTGIVSRLTPQQWATLRAGRPLVLSTDPQPGEPRLPADVELTFRSTQPTLYPPGVTVRFSDPNGEERMRQQEKQLQEQWAAATGFQVVLRLDGDPSRNRGSMMLRAESRPVRSGAPGSPGSTFFFGGSGTSLYIGASPLDGRQQMLENTLQRSAELEKDPVVGVKLPFKPELKPQVDPFGTGSGPRWRGLDMLPDLARTYGIQILADAYSGNGGPNFGVLPAATGPTALFTLLDRYTSFSHRWDRRGKMIRLRSRTWFLDRPREIPLRLIRNWNEQQEQNGALSLDTYLAMATTLTDAQLDALNSLSMEHPSLSLYEVARGRHALRLYATLSPAQRQQLPRGGTLTVAQMTLPQRRLFLSSLEDSNRGRPQPMNLDQWMVGSFSLSAQRFIRTVEKTGGATRARMEPVDPPPGTAGTGGAPGTAAVQRVAGATQSAPLPGTPPGSSVLPSPTGVPRPASETVSRFPVTRLELKLQYASEQIDRVSFTVAEQR